MDIPILATAIILQLVAAILAFRLVRLSQGRVAWMLIAAAVFLLAVRLAVTLAHDFVGDDRHYYGLGEHFLSLAVAILLVAGIFAIRPLFLACRQSEAALWRARAEAERQTADTEKLLEENRQRLALLEAIIEATQDGIAIYGPDGELLRLNAAAEEYLGLTAAERALTIDRRWELLRVEKIDGTPLPLEEIPAKRALAGEKAQAILHLRPHRRPPRWFSVSAAPIRTAGARASAVAILTDITDFHTLQENQEIFMQMISHDLRTPVTVIQGHAELLDEHLAERDELTALNIEAILAATRQLTGMMEDLTRMIHLDRGQLPLELEPLDIADFVGRLLLRITTPGSVMTVEQAFPPGLPPVYAEPASLERILTNLVTNAVKYSPPDTAVRLAAEVAGEELRIAVSDRGPGIAPEDQPYLFDRFFRARATGRKRGIGLGLYITRSLVEAHGGRVWVESAPGEGSTFTFTLPLRPPAPA